MFGAIAGDIIGAPYEGIPNKTKNFDIYKYNNTYFTDDTVMSIAVGYAIVTNQPYKQVMRKLGRMYPAAGYGGSFFKWLHSEVPKPYNSWGNGSAMRVSPIAWAFDNKDTVLVEAKKSAEVSHNHPEGIKGAQAVALSVFLARKGVNKKQLKHEIEEQFGYELSESIDKIRINYEFDVTCQGSVPQAIIAFLESDGVEDAILNAISLGGDADTQAAIAGSIAEAYYGEISPKLLNFCISKIDTNLLNYLLPFSKKYLFKNYTKKLEKIINQRNKNVDDI